MYGGWSCVVRFACHLPFGWVGFAGSGLYNCIKGLDDTGIFDVIPHGRAFLYGLQMYSTWGIFGFAWNFAMFLGCLACVGYLCLLLGIVDLMIAIALAVSVAKQAQFMPTTYGACGGVTDWRNGTDGRNFFLTANSTTFDSYGKPENLCTDLVRAWAITIAMVILYGITGIINIALCAGLVCYDRQRHPSYPNNRRNTPRESTFSRVLTMTVTVLREFLTRWMWDPTLFVSDMAFAAFRFGVRYSCKVFQKWRGQKHGLGARYQKSERTDRPIQEKDIDRPVPEKDIDADEMLQLLSDTPEECHFVDLVNASDTSKILRMQLFGTGDAPDPAELEDLRKITCQKDTKSSCDICGIQICAECETKLRVATSLSSIHKIKCLPHCSRCFYAEGCRGRATEGKRWGEHRGTCQLSVKDSDTDIEMRTSAGQMKAVCRNCASLTPAERAEEIEMKDQRELEQLARQPGSCAKCNTTLPAKGPSWRICQHCHTECTSHVHPPWAAA